MVQPRFALVVGLTLVLAWHGVPFAVADDVPRLPSVPTVATIGADGIQRAVMTLDSYSYTPSHLVVRVGLPVELTLTSVTFLTPHNFVMKEGGLLIDQDVSAGEAVKLRFTPFRSGSFMFYCDEQLLFFKSHRERGMEGILEVTP